MKNEINFAEALLKTRIENNLTQTKLAELTGIKQQNISRWEAGKNLPNIEECVKLADFFGISLDEFVGREV